MSAHICQTCHQPLPVVASTTRKSVGWLRGLGEEIRAYRRANRLTQLDLALELGYSQKHISDVERGSHQITDEFLDNWIEFKRKQRSMAMPPKRSTIRKKHCVRCKEFLPLSDFTVDRSKKDQRCIYCRNCNKQRGIERKISGNGDRICNEQTGR